MDVRPATVHDARAIASVHVRSWRAAYTGLLPDGYLESLSVDRGESMWEEIVRDTDSWVLVVVDGDQVVGFAHACLSRDEDAQRGVGELTSIYLAPEVWGRGGGRLLMERACEQLRDGGFRSVSLWVLETNDRARTFYEVLGWAPDGARKLDEERGFPAVEVRYRRDL
jgi:GNAT superfamily N-acetyltransferase